MKVLFSLLIQILMTKTTAEVISGPISTYLLLGDDVNLTCKVNDHTSGLVNWYRIEPSDANEGGGVFCSIESDLDEFSCFTTSHYDNFEMKIINDDTKSYDYQYNVQITGVEEDDLGEYDCYAGSAPSSGSVLCVGVDADDIYVDIVYLNGTKLRYNGSNEIGEIPLSDTLNIFANSTLMAIAENSQPETTFGWSFAYGSNPTTTIPLESEPSNYGIVNNENGCQPFLSNSSLVLSSNFATDYIITVETSTLETNFSLKLTATNEITGKITPIEWTGTFIADNGASSSGLTMGRNNAILVATAVALLVAKLM